MLGVALFCWLTWSGSALTLTAGLLLLLARPSTHFEAGQTLTIAGSERGLRSAKGLPLTSLQRGRRPRVCLDASGDALSSPGHAAVILVQQRDGLAWGGGAGLEQSERVGRRWRPVAPGEAPRAGVRYRVGSLYLRLD
ncbi:MAG: hypothetical protein P8R54_31035 [Myxococcota bacterium]|nr:hypothetical protein [Myxococcota bacterium]